MNQIHQPNEAILAEANSLRWELGENLHDSVIESIYQELRKHKFARGNWMQTAANIMYLADGTARAVAGRAGALKAEFRKRKVRIQESDYSEVAMLSLLDLPSRVVVARVMQIREALDEVRPKILLDNARRVLGL